MPHFICQICNKKISYPIGDMFFRDAGECVNCYSVIVKGRYEKNIPGTTVFGSMGDALGDRVVQKAVLDYYKKDNPDERVLVGDKYLDMPHNKLFWARDIQSRDNKTLAMPPDAIWFRVNNEANLLVKQGVYASWDNFIKPNISLPGVFAVVHFRNASKGKCKNVHLSKKIRILQELKDYAVVVVGNDEREPGEPLTENIVDLRYKLNLDEIAWLCKNCLIFVGPDSGVAHVAAAAGCDNMVCFGYGAMNWTPKTKPEYYTALHRNESTDDRIADEIKYRLR
jgi:hypothetical protein